MIVPGIEPPRYRCETNDHYVREHIQHRPTPYALVCTTYAAGIGGSDRAVTQHVCRDHDEIDRHDAVDRVRLPRHVAACREFASKGKTE